MSHSLGYRVGFGVFIASFSMLYAFLARLGLWVFRALGLSGPGKSLRFRVFPRWVRLWLRFEGHDNAQVHVCVCIYKYFYVCICISTYVYVHMQEDMETVKGCS